MSIKKPFTDLEIKTADRGFYEGNSVSIALLRKGIMVAFVLWALVWPQITNTMESAAIAAWVEANLPQSDVSCPIAMYLILSKIAS